jgi:hypothetical protein
LGKAITVQGQQNKYNLLRNRWCLLVLTIKKETLEIPGNQETININKLRRIIYYNYQPSQGQKAKNETGILTTQDKETKQVR